MWDSRGLHLVYRVKIPKNHVLAKRNNCPSIQGLLDIHTGGVNLKNWKAYLTSAQAVRQHYVKTFILAENAVFSRNTWS